MSVIGSISIKDNVTATLRIIKKEQTSFREDDKKTREEMEKTWKEKNQAKRQSFFEKLKRRFEQQ